jgi:hypothetical protein
VKRRGGVEQEHAPDARRTSLCVPSEASRRGPP